MSFMHFTNYLIIDTSMQNPFVSIVNAKDVLEYHILPVGDDQAAVLDFLVKQFDFDVIAVAIGPGRFSSIRLGLAFAQGLSLAKNVPLIGFSSLEGYLSKVCLHTALLFPLGKKGGVISFFETSTSSGDSELGVGQLVTYEQGLQLCLEKGCTRIVTPDASLFKSIFEDHLELEEIDPDIKVIQATVIDRFKNLQKNNKTAIQPDYRSHACFF